MLSAYNKQMWEYRFLEIVLGKSQLADITLFGKKYNWGEPWKVRLYGAIASEIAKRKEEIAKDLVAANLAMIPKLILPDSPVVSLIPKNKLKIKQPGAVKGIVKNSTHLVSIFLPLAVYNKVVLPVLTEQERVEWEEKIVAAWEDADKLTSLIAALIELVKARHGGAYEEILSETRESVVQDLFDYVKDTTDEYQYLAGKKSFRRYEEMARDQDIVGLTQAYAGGK
jgi:hypothetical protein